MSITYAEFNTAVANQIKAIMSRGKDNIILLVQACSRKQLPEPDLVSLPKFDFISLNLNTLVVTPLADHFC